MTEEWKQQVTDEELVRLVENVARSWVPGVVCELKDYKQKIGLGALDDDGEVQEVRFLKKHLSNEQVEIQSKLLLKKLYPGQPLDV